MQRQEDTGKNEKRNKMKEIAEVRKTTHLK